MYSAVSFEVLRSGWSWSNVPCSLGTWRFATFAACSFCSFEGRLAFGTRVFELGGVTP